MIKYSFYTNGGNEELENKARNLLEKTGKKILYTFGLKYRNPTTYMVPVTNEKALGIFDTEWCDVTEYEDYVDLNAYSSNDMW